MLAGPTGEFLDPSLTFERVSSPVQVLQECPLTCPLPPGGPLYPSWTSPDGPPTRLGPLCVSPDPSRTYERFPDLSQTSGRVPQPNPDLW